MKRYRCHKVVEAAKIIRVCIEDGVVPRDGVCLELDVPKSPTYWQVTPEWFARHKPEAGGYLVLYKGYMSFSPAKAFEDGYTLIAVEG